MALIGNLISTVIFVGIFIGIFGLLSMGLNIHWGDAGLLNFAVAGFFMVGAYTSAILTTPAVTQTFGSVTLGSRTVGADLPVLVGMAAGTILAGIAGVLIALTSVRLEGDYLAMVTLGLAEVLHTFVHNEEWMTAGTQTLKGIPRPFSDFVATLPITYDFFYLIFVGVILAVTWFLLERLSSSPFGRVLKGIREDEAVIKALGRHTEVYKLKAFGIGAAVSGLAGALYAHYIYAIQPSIFSPSLTFLVWTAVIIGGPGSYLGAVLGMGFIQLINQLTRYIPTDIPLGSDLAYIRLIIIGLLLIGILYYKPEGMLGDRERMLAGESSGGE